MLEHFNMVETLPCWFKPYWAVDTGFKYSHLQLELGLQHAERQTYILFGTRRTKPAENAGVSSLSLRKKRHPLPFYTSLRDDRVEDPDILFCYFHLLLFPSSLTSSSSSLRPQEVCLWQPLTWVKSVPIRGAFSVTTTASSTLSTTAQSPPRCCTRWASACPLAA